MQTTGVQSDEKRKVGKELTEVLPSRMKCKTRSTAIKKGKPVKALLLVKLVK